MELSGLEYLIYGLLSGLTEIFPVSSRAHGTLMLKVLGAERINGFPVLLIHIALLAAIYYSSRAELTKMHRARKLARIPKKRRKRPLDICSLMDFRFLLTMMLPVLLAVLLYGQLSGVTFSLLAISALLFINGILIYIPQFVPGSNKDARSLSRVEGLLMGLGGALSIIPGLSGIGIAASIGFMLGVDRKYAINMSLMMSMVYFAGMIVYDVMGIIEVGFGILTFQWILVYILTAVLAFVGALVAIRIMRQLAAGSGICHFSFYCWGIAIFAFILNLMA